MIITSAIGVVMYAVVFLRTREDASLLTSALVLAYCLYLQWSALSSNTDATCNPFQNPGLNNTANTITMMVLGLLFTFASLFVISATTKKDSESDSNLT
jgi:nicotinamide riboside transporter PnuC